MESKERLFTGKLRAMIKLRDPYRRVPWCSNKPKNADHIEQYRKGGDTSYINSGLKCPSCDLAKKDPEWVEEVVGIAPHQFIIRPTKDRDTKAEGNNDC